jgi:hypothetical protein
MRGRVRSPEFRGTAAFDVVPLESGVLNFPLTDPLPRFNAASILAEKSGEPERYAVRCGLQSANEIIRGDVQGAAVVAPGAIGGYAEKNGS